MKLLTVAVLFPAAIAFSGNDVSSASRKLSPDATNRRSFISTSAAALLATGTAALRPQQSQAAVSVGGKMQLGDNSIMSAKAHGTSANPVQADLMYGVSNTLADRICNFNRRGAEQAGYFKSTNWEKAVLEATGPITFYDSVTGKALFVAPIGRSAKTLVKESEVHGWPSFRDEEVVWDNVKVIRNSGETVSVDGTHLGHNLPDRNGNRYCINLVCIAGQPTTSA
jgi:peptide methionine sulfoxide reductase MsrB